MAFGERLQELRRRSGLTQEELAEQLQVSRQAVSKWESGRGYPEVEKLLYICERCGTTMDELFADELPEKSSAPQEKPMPRSTLKGALANFYNNLSPYNKFVGIGLLIVLALLGPAYAFGTRVMKGEENESMIPMVLIWVGAIIVFGIAEAATAGLVSIWFVGGAIAALIAALLGASLWVQIALFLIASAALLVATRPLAKKIHEKAVPTNLDRVLYAAARVTEEVDNEHSTGAVYIDGKTWTARSEDGSVIAKDTMVEIVRMEGVKLFVKVKEE